MLLSALGSAVLLTACGVAIGKRWPVFSAVARAIGRLGWIKTWLDGKQSVIEAAEKNLFDFFHKAPGIFWGSLVLNLASHATAILEVYVLLYFMGRRKSLLVALVVEALTKLINVVGTLNPGNVGTFEGGNMIVARLIHISGGAGLTIALCRRVRILFWAAIGAICLTVMSKSPNPRWCLPMQRHSQMVPTRFSLDLSDPGNVSPPPLLQFECAHIRSNVRIRASILESPAQIPLTPFVFDDWRRSVWQ